jgi:AcrR family transcriptional regulator
MRQNSPLPRRPRGRPQIRSDEETHHLIVEAARQEFQTNGYAATTMCAVAQRAGLSTKTMYRLIPTKADLFSSVISDRIGRFMPAIDAGALDAYELTEATERILIAYGTLTLDAETIALIRLVLAEGDRFPELAATFYEDAIVRTSNAMASWLERLCKRGLIRLDDSHAASDALRGMMTMELQRAVMLGQRAAPDAEEIAERARFCAQLFLSGCKAPGS